MPRVWQWHRDLGPRCRGISFPKTQFGFLESMRVCILRAYAKNTHARRSLFGDFERLCPACRAALSHVVEIGSPYGGVLVGQSIQAECLFLAHMPSVQTDPQRPVRSGCPMGADHLPQYLAPFPPMSHRSAFGEDLHLVPTASRPKNAAYHNPSSPAIPSENPFGLGARTDTP